MVTNLLEELSSALTSDSSSSASSSEAASSASSASGGSGNIFADFWNKVVNFFSDNVWNIIRFFAILVIGIIVICIIMAIIKKVLRLRKIDPIVVKFVSGIIRFCLLLVLVLILLSAIGVQITGITTAISAAVLAVGMALKDNLSNLANGIILVVSDKYKTGDYIIVGSVEGSITEINFLFTALKTKDGKQVLMPNSTMVNSQVTNLGYYPTRRIELTIPVAYDSDVEKVKEIVTSVMRSDGRVYLEPAPFCALKTLNKSSIDFFCHCWVDGSDYWDVYFYLMEHIFDELKRNHIRIPYEQVEIRERTDNVVMPYTPSGLPERVEKRRVVKKKKMSIDEMEEATFGELVEHSKANAKSHKKAKQEKKAKKARKKTSSKQPEEEQKS